MIGPYTREKIRNLNDECNSSLECEFSRGGTNLSINTVAHCVHKHKSHVSQPSPPKRRLGSFCVHTQNSHCNLSETSLEFTSGLEFEFVIVISIRDSNLLTCTRAKNSSLELFFTGMIIQMTNFCPCVSARCVVSYFHNSKVLSL